MASRQLQCSRSNIARTVFSKLTATSQVCVCSSQVKTADLLELLSIFELACWPCFSSSPESPCLPTGLGPRSVKFDYHNGDPKVPVLDKDGHAALWREAWQQCGSASKHPHFAQMQEVARAYL